MHHIISWYQSPALIGIMSYKDALHGQSRAFAVDGDNPSSQSPSSDADRSSVGHSGQSQSTPSVGTPDPLSQVPMVHRLTENNYLQWSRNFLMFIRGKDKEHYLLNDPPLVTSAEYKAWKAENNMVMAWLINSMTVEIGENYLLASSAKQIWDSTRKIFSVQENTAAILQIKRSLRDLYQGDRSVTQYYTALGKLWQKLDLYETFEWSCNADVIYHKRVLDRDRCYDFLLGLNDSFEDTRGRIMGIRPLPLLEDVFNMVKWEESRRLLTKNPVDQSSITSELSALAVRGNNNDAKTKKSSKWCDHCKKSGHYKETCWVLHGKPPQSKQKGRSDSKGMAVGVPEESGAGLSNEELLVLRKILEKHSNSSSSQISATTPSVTLAKSGTALTYALSSVSLSKDLWVVDSGATHHVTGFREVFSDFTDFSNHKSVEVANGQYSEVLGCGTVVLSNTIALHDVLYVPEIECSLLSVKQIVDHLNCQVAFNKNGCFFQDLALGKLIGNAKLWNGLYYLHGSSPNKCHAVFSAMSNEDIQLWHSRLGHPSFHSMQILFPNLSNKTLSDFHCNSCQFGKQVRNSYHSHSYQSSSPFSLIHSDVWGPSKVVTGSKARWFVTFIDDHTRLTWVALMKDKSEVLPIFKNFFHFVHTQFQTSIQVLRSDNGREYLNSNFKLFLTQNGIHHQTSCVYTPQQNGVAERKNRHLLEVARTIMFESNVPSRFWGDAVLTSAYLINRMPSKILKFQSPIQKFAEHFPKSHLLNSIPQKVFGCTAFVYNEGGSKLDPRALKCIFLGYSSTQKGYKCFCPLTNKSYVTSNVKFLEKQPYFSKPPIQGERRSEWLVYDSSNDVTSAGLESDSQLQGSHMSPVLLDFYPISSGSNPVSHSDSAANTAPINNTLEPNNQTPRSPRNRLQNSSPETEIQTANRFEPLTLNPESESSETRMTAPNETTAQHHGMVDSSSTSQQTHDSVPETNPEEADLYWPIALRKGKRKCTTQHPIARYVSYRKLAPHMKTFVANVEKDIIPKTFDEAICDPKWKEAIEEELRALHKNGTWKITSLPKGKSVVSSKWVFTIKYNSDGSINKYKARLVARGFTQTYGIDYQETFAPVAKFNTIRVLLSIAANLDWPLHQMDVKNAFLNGDLEEEVYMEVPLGLRSSDNSDKVCRLYKSLYGLKQSPRAWFERFTQAIKNQGYKQCQADDTLFIKNRDGRKTILIVYVDDIVLTGDDVEEIEMLKKHLASEFDIKDLGPLRYFLGMEVARTNKGISVSQRKYTLDLLKETGMLGARPAYTPMELNQKLTIRPDGTAVNQERYQKLVGKLIYLSHTRPDISFPVSVVSQFSSSPQKEHLTAVYRILRYLKRTPGLGLFFEKGSIKNVELYTDADWGGSKIDRRSTTGYCTYVWGNLVTWRSKKQPVVSRSSAESEYRALSHGVCEGVWIMRLLKEIEAAPDEPIKVWCDNMSTIKIARNPIQHDRMKHVEIDRHFIREKLETKVIDLSHISSEKQTADIMTKSFTQGKFEGLRSNLGMINIYSPA